MVRGRVRSRSADCIPTGVRLGFGMLLITLILPGCRHDRDMPEKAEMPDSTRVMRAMHQPAARDAMLDTIPGGEMARGDSASANRLLKKKM